MDDNKPVVKLTAEQECIQVLASMLGAIHFQTTDPITKQFIVMLIAQAAKEYTETTHDPLSQALFNSVRLITEFRQAMSIIKQAQDEQALEKARIFPKRKIEIARK